MAFESRISFATFQNAPAKSRQGIPQYIPLWLKYRPAFFLLFNLTRRQIEGIFDRLPRRKWILRVGRFALSAYPLLLECEIYIHAFGDVILQQPLFAFARFRG